MMLQRAGALAFALLLATASGAAVAATGEPEPWQLGLQEAVTPIHEEVVSFHNLVLIIITAITVFVLGLLGYVCWRFRASAHPTPSRVSHHPLLEVLWTAVPVLILVVIAVPSFKLLYYQDVLPEADMTVKATGRQWYWTYAYPDHGNFSFDAYMKFEDELKEGEPRLLQTDNLVVVPVDATVRLLVTSSDVIHSWAMPSFGVKIDAVPGRLNETWFRVEEEGTYYGQCSELCGINHGFMPIAVKAVSEDEFANWVSQAQEQYARAGAVPSRVAARVAE